MSKKKIKKNAAILLYSYKPFPYYFTGVNIKFSTCCAFYFQDFKISTNTRTLVQVRRFHLVFREAKTSLKACKDSINYMPSHIKLWYKRRFHRQEKLLWLPNTIVHFLTVVNRRPFYNLKKSIIYPVYHLSFIRLLNNTHSIPLTL